LDQFQSQLCSEAELTDAAKSTTAFSQEQKALLNWQATLQHLHQHHTPWC
jgi:hypothetical protein